MTTETTTSPTAHPTPQPRTRASDTEREDTVARLHHALGEGRLDLAETEERVATAYAAQYRDELPALLADLPGAGPAVTGNRAAPSWAELWIGAVWRARAVLLGADGVERPTATQRRTAALVTGLALLWTIVCAFLGAGLVH